MDNDKSSVPNFLYSPLTARLALSRNLPSSCLFDNSMLLTPTNNMKLLS